MKILIVKLSSLGDVIHTLPVLGPLKKRYPDASISWLVEKESSSLLYDHPLVDTVLIFPKSRWRNYLSSIRSFHRGLKEIPHFVRTLRSESYDMVLDFQGLFKSGLLTGLARAREKWGFYPGREQSHVFLTHRVALPVTPVHSVDRYLSLVHRLGCRWDIPEFIVPIQQVHRSSVLAYLDKQGITGARPIIILHPGTRWKTKMWEERKWAVLADRLQSTHNYDIVFTGSRQDGTLVNRIVQAMADPAVNSAGVWRLNELAYLHTRAMVVVTPDSGPMHLAAAVGTPVVALFGPTDPHLTGPYGDGHTVITRQISCRPCFKRQCASPRCMSEITPEEVYAAVNRYAERSPEQQRRIAQ